MPAISVDTFFACSLMVVLVLSAMAGTSKLLYPHINNAVDGNFAERYREIARYLLLDGGTPSDWGQAGQTIPETFGLAKVGSGSPYDLDIDKVSRLNSENLYKLSYAEIFSALKMSDVSFRIEITPIFGVSVNLTATFHGAIETIYQFEISTEKHGVPVQAELNCYVVAENYLEASHAYPSGGRTSLNVTISNNVNSPGLLVVFARSIHDTKIASFNAYGFAHNSAEPQPKGTFLELSPLNHTLDASFKYPEIALSNAYALTFNCNSTLMQAGSSSNSTTYSIPHFLDSSPTLLVVTGRNSTVFLTEWITYPHIPLQIGPDFANSITLSNVFAYTYTITINSALYECTIWVGGPRE